MNLYKRLKESWSSWWGSNYTFNNLTTEYLDDEMQGWQALTREANSYQGDLVSFHLDDVRRASQYLYQFNAHYRGLVRTYLKYVLGKPYKIISQEEKEIQAWTTWQKKYYWRKFSQELGRRYYRDGEVFIWTPEWKFINPALVSSPVASRDNIFYGVESEGGDATKIVAYWIQQGKSHTRIPSEEVIYVGEKDCDEWRSLPYFLSTFVKCREFEKWLGDRLQLNRVRASIAILRKHKNASPTAVAGFAEAKKTTTISDKSPSYGGTLRQKFYEPGTVIDHNDSVDYTFLSPNIHADDVANDGRNVLLSLAAATGLPEFFVSGDSSNANYASHLVSEGTAVREFEYWQNFFTDVISEIWWNVLEQAGLEPSGDPEITVPSLVTRNAFEETKRNEILYTSGVISRAEWQRREGVDPEKADKEITHEQEADLT